MNINIRDYQSKGIEEIINAWKEFRSVLFQMPTGTGKTTLFCEIVRKFINDLYPDKKVLIVMHRSELVDQASLRLKSFGINAGIISAKFPKQELYSASVQVASVQTLVNRTVYHEDVFSLVIIDESHHALASTYKKLWNFYPNSKFLGVTATPTRTDGQGFYDLFDKLITSYSVKWFIKNRHLCDTQYFASHSPDVSDIKLKAGDYDETILGEVMQDVTLMADLVQSYIKWAEGKKIIVFAVNRVHSRKIVEKYNNNGFLAKSIDAYTPSYERQRIVNEFKNDEFKILVNVNIFTEGFDCPDVDGVQLARPTKSLTLYLQQVGRCMRPHTNKEYGIIMDNAGLWKEHGLPKMDRNWSLLSMEDAKCTPSKNSIVGINVRTQNRKELKETEGLRLVEIGELEDDLIPQTISYDEIEKQLIEKREKTMEERYRELDQEIRGKLEEVTKLHQAKLYATTEEKLEIDIKLDKMVDFFILENYTKNEFNELREKLQPKRFERLINLVLDKCYEVIENADFLVYDDKEKFLNSFVEPSLRTENEIKRNASKSNNTDNVNAKHSSSNTKTKASSPSAIKWIEQIPELTQANNLTSWTDICDYFKLNHKGNSARRVLESWVKKNKPNWVPVPRA